MLGLHVHSRRSPYFYSHSYCISLEFAENLADRLFRCQNVPEADDDDLVQASPQAEFWHKVGSGNSPSTLQDKTAVQSSK